MARLLLCCSAVFAALLSLNVQAQQLQMLLDDDAARVQLLTVSTGRSVHLVPTTGIGTGWVSLTDCAYRSHVKGDPESQPINPGDSGFVNQTFAQSPVEFGGGASDCKVLIIEQKKIKDGPAFQQPLTIDYSKLPPHHDRDDSVAANESLLIAISSVDLQYTPTEAFRTEGDKPKISSLKMKPLEVRRIPAGAHQWHNNSKHEAIFVRAVW